MAKKSEDNSVSPPLTCGLVMPISAIDGCTADHWAEVKNIICDAVSAIEGLTFVPKLVSEQDDVGVIQKRIVQNIYSSDIVICDVSCKNANVMFELGMRLAFDKPTILIKDDKTDFSFDTGVIEHLLYPRDLRFSRIVSFKKSLAEKVYATYQASISDPAHSTFLKNFGSFKVAALNQTEGTPDQVMLDMLQDISRDVSRLKRNAFSVLNKNSPHKLDQMSDIHSAFQTYKEVNGWAGSSFDLIGNDSFYDFMEGHVNLRFYESRKSLVTAVDDYVLTSV
ncbi:hypothetical protein KVG88_00310 [Pseudomonas sp. SWRI74]|uniref:RNA helicase n=1 Tax=Pseudomonas azerbaijanoccidentalis TaxID=2842347 RepID=A0ABS6QHT1_9PSED|nr:hypothetical protein [Pseudomonas azerbaijanoccidentalis]MBV4518490.1 hypothetical protein [Pseudomonas azerbaijanoccidentalis]